MRTLNHDGAKRVETRGSPLNSNPHPKFAARQGVACRKPTILATQKCVSQRYVRASVRYLQ